MNKIALMTSLCMLSCLAPALAQDWSDVQVDANLQVTLPTGYVASDTLGVKYFLGELEHAAIILNKVESSNPNHYADVDELNRGYDRFLRGMTSRFERPEVVTNEEIQIGKLIGRQLKVQFEALEETMVTQGVVVILKDITYSAQFVYPLQEEEVINASKDLFFGSIRFSEELDHHDQLTPGSIMGLSPYQQGELLGQLFVYLIIPITLLIAWIIRRKRKQTQPHQEG